MNTIEELKKLKNLLDNNVISETEFNSFKLEILGMPTLNFNETPHSKGSVVIRFIGQWFIFDFKSKLYINNQLHSENSTKHGFSQKIDFVDSEINFKVKLTFKTTEFSIRNLDSNKNYDLELFYDDMWGKFSKNYKIREV